MSEEIKPEVTESVPQEVPITVASPAPEPTDAQIKAKAATDLNAKVEARAKELQGYKGKFFRQKGSPNAPVVEIMDYGGVKSKTVADGKDITKVSAHTFVVEMKGARWSPAATAFLEAYEEVEKPKQPAISEIL